MALCEVKLWCPRLNKCVSKPKKGNRSLCCYLYNDPIVPRIVHPIIKTASDPPRFFQSYHYSYNRWPNRPLSCPIGPIRTRVHASTLIKIFTRECLQKLNLHSSTWLRLFSMKPALKLQVQLGVSFICKR